VLAQSRDDSPVIDHIYPPFMQFDTIALLYPGHWNLAISINFLNAITPLWRNRIIDLLLSSFLKVEPDKFGLTKIQ
jgi:hypothetical protein